MRSKFKLKCARGSSPSFFFCPGKVVRGTGDSKRCKSAKTIPVMGSRVDHCKEKMAVCMS